MRACAEKYKLYQYDNWTQGRTIWQKDGQNAAKHMNGFLGGLKRASLLENNTPSRYELHWVRHFKSISTFGSTKITENGSLKLYVIWLEII